MVDKTLVSTGSEEQTFLGSFPRISWFTFRKNLYPQDKEKEDVPSTTSKMSQLRSIVPNVGSPDILGL